MGAAAGVRSSAATCLADERPVAQHVSGACRSFEVHKPVVTGGLRDQVSADAFFVGTSPWRTQAAVHRREAAIGDVSVLNFRSPA